MNETIIRNKNKGNTLNKINQLIQMYDKRTRIYDGRIIRYLPSKCTKKQDKKK